MNIYTCNDFEGFWPVGSAAAVVAESEEAARALLQAALKAKGLPDGFTLELLDVNKAQAVILCDGDY